MIPIYPLSGVKTRSCLAGAGGDSFRRIRGLVWRKDHQQNGGKNGAAGDERSQADWFAAERPAEE